MRLCIITSYNSSEVSLACRVHNFTCLWKLVQKHYEHVVTVTGANPHAGIAADEYNKRPIANNGLIIARSDDRIRLVCVSNSSQPDVGEIIGLDGNTLTSGSGWDVNNGANLPGFIRATNAAFTATDQGIYTCDITDDNGNVMVFNVGLYSTVFNGECIDCM